MADTSSLQKCVLLVDDDEYLSDVICSAIIQNGADATHVGTLGAAMVELMRKDYSLVLLDLGLPDSSSSNTMACLAHIITRARCPVVVITGSDPTENLVERAKSAGVKDVISKNSFSLTNKLVVLLAET